MHVDISLCLWMGVILQKRRSEVLVITFSRFWCIIYTISTIKCCQNKPPAHRSDKMQPLSIWRGIIEAPGNSLEAVPEVGVHEVIKMKDLNGTWMGLFLENKITIFPTSLLYFFLLFNQKHNKSILWFNLVNMET